MSVKLKRKHKQTREKPEFCINVQFLWNIKPIKVNKNLEQVIFHENDADRFQSGQLIVINVRILYVKSFWYLKFDVKNPKSNGNTMSLDFCSTGEIMGWLDRFHKKYPFMKI